MCREERLARVGTMEEQGLNREVTVEMAVQAIEDFCLGIITDQRIPQTPQHEWVRGIGCVPRYSGATKVAKPETYLYKLLLVAKHCYTLLRSGTVSTTRALLSQLGCGDSPIHR